MQTNINDEKTAREAADTALETKVGNEVTAREDADTKLQSAIDEEARKRKYSVTNLENADKQLQTNIDNEAADRKAADTALQASVDTNTNDIADLKKADTTLQTNIDNEAAARKAEDTRLNSEIVKTNTSLNEAATNLSKLNTAVVEGFKTLNQADANEAKAREAADAALDDKITAETAGRVAADTKLVKAMNSGLSLSEDNVLQKDTTTIDAQGNVTPSKTDANEMILNKGDNQITLNEKGIKVGTNSSVMDKNGVYTGGDTYSEAKAALKSDGSIKGADGKFTVNSANGTVNVNNQIELNGATGVVISNSLNVGNGNFTVNTDGNVATKGTLSAADGKFTVTTDGGVSAAGGKAVINSDGKITAASVDAGSGTIQTTGTIQGGTITDGTASLSEGNLTGLESVETKELKTTGDAEIGGSLTVNQDLTVKGKFNADTLNSREDKNNYTTISGGNVTSKNLVMSDEGNIEASYSNLDETGSDVWARDDDSKGSSTVTADSVKQSISDVGDNAKNYASRELSQNTDNKYEITDSVVRGNQSNAENRTADTTDSQISLKDDSGKVLNKSYITQNLKKVLMGVEEGNNKTTIEQDANNITNTAENGTITNIAKDLVNTASENMTNNVGKDLTTTVGGEMKTTVTGDVTEDYKSNLSTTVGRNQTTTVTGDSSLTAENINNEAKNKIINKALDVETDAKSSIVNKVSNEYGSNTSTQLSYETKEKMSQADGKTASYLRGAAEEKSQLTDGDKKTTIDTIAGQTNTNITDGTNTSNNLQKADQVASSVKNGDNQTVSNQDAESLASSATDGTNTTVANQNAKSFSSAATDGTNTSVVSQDAKSINSAVTDGTNSTGIRQDAQNIALSANNGTIAASAKNITNTASETLSNSAKNINNTATDKLSNSAADIENKASKSILNQVGEKTSWTMTDGKVLESIKGADGQTNTITDTADSTVQNVKNGKNELTSTTSSTNADLTITNGSSAYTKVNTATGNKETVKEGENLASTNLTKDGFNVYAQDENGHNTIINNASGTTQTIQTDDKHLNVTTKTVGSSDEKLTSGSSVIDVLKSFDDAANPAITSSVTDGTNTSEVKQTASEVATSAKDISNTASTSITDKVGENTTWKMTDGKISESIVNGTASNKENTTVDGTKRIITSAEGTGTYNQTATSNNISMKNAAGDTSFTKAESLEGEKTSVTNANGSSTINQSADSIVNFVKNKDGDTTRTEQSATDITNSAKSGTITNDAKDVLNKGTNSVINEVGDNQVAVKTDSVKAAYGSDASTTWNADGITNTASKSIISQIGDGSKVKSEMTADGITNTAEGGTIYNKSKDILNEASGDIINWADGEIGNVATKITNITGSNTVTSDTNGTTFENTDHSTAIKDGAVTKTTISGNTMETGLATMDYAEVMKDLGVHGNATIKGDTTMEGNASVGKNLTVAGTSKLTGDVTMENNASVGKNLTVKGDTEMDGNATVKKNLTVEGETNLKNTKVDGTLNVTGSSEFGGAATFNGEVTFKEAVSMEKDLSVGGNVDAASYTVKGTDIKIDKDGINAGGKVIRNVGQGDISEGSTDAVSGGQLYETNTRVSGLETRMGTVETKVDKLDNKIDKVGANAAAMANLHPLEFDEDSKWNIAAAVGSSGSETASAVGVFYRPNENVMVNASVAMGTGENMFGGGVSLRLGHGGNKAKEAQMKAAAKENRELRAKVDDLTARMDALLSVLNPNMSKDFPDVPENHWAYEAVSRLAGNGIVEGYEDGKYHGERQMTRYEMAEIIYNALSKGAKAEKKLVEEFRPELQAMAAQKRA